MVFTKRLREGVRRGEITCSVRFWISPRVTVGKRYRVDEGAIEIDSIEPIGLPDITPELARESGFLGVLDLLKIAKHGRGENIYLIRFHYVRRRTKKKRDAQVALNELNDLKEKSALLNAKRAHARGQAQSRRYYKEDTGWKPELQH